MSNTPTVEELYAMVNDLKSKVEQLSLAVENGGGKTVVKKRKPTPLITNTEPEKFDEMIIHPVDGDIVNCTFVNDAAGEVTSTIKFNKDQWNKLVEQLGAKENGDSLVISDYDMGEHLSYKSKGKWLISN